MFATINYIITHNSICKNWVGSNGCGGQMSNRASVSASATVSQKKHTSHRKLNSESYIHTQIIGHVTIILQFTFRGAAAAFSILTAIFSRLHSCFSLTSIRGVPRPGITYTAIPTSTTHHPYFTTHSSLPKRPPRSLHYKRNEITVNYIIFMN